MAKLNTTSKPKGNREEARKGEGGKGADKKMSKKGRHRGKEIQRDEAVSKRGGGDQQRREDGRVSEGSVGAMLLAMTRNPMRR